jgi:hypothetical protein
MRYGSPFIPCCQRLTGIRIDPAAPYANVLHLLAIGFFNLIFFAPSLSLLKVILSGDEK